MRDRTWREGDLRGIPEVRPASVSVVVRRTWMGLSAARWAESVLVAVAGMCILLAVAGLEGIALGSLDAWIVALSGGALAGAAWRLEHSLGEREVAGALDRRLRHRGALLTAWETEGRASETSVARLLRARVLARLRTREALRAMAPPLAVPLAAPIAGVAFLALVLERDRARDDLPPVNLGALTENLDELSTQVLEARDEGIVDQATARKLIAMKRRLGDLAGVLARAEDAPEQALAEVEAIDRELAILTPRLRRDPALAAMLDAVRPTLDAARTGLSRHEPASGADEGENGGESGTGALTGGGEDGTMAGSSDPAPVPPAARPTDPGPTGAAGGELPEAGSIAGRWWPEEHDEIVARWTEILRRAHREREGSPDPDGG